MSRRILAVALLGAIMAPLARAAPAVDTGGRHFKLEGELPEGVHRCISAAIKNLSLDGDRPTTWETLTRTGTFHDPRYGEFEITRSMLLEMVSNFEKRTYGQEVFIDVGHEPRKGAAAKVIKLAVEGNKLRGLLEWTPYGVDAVKQLGMRYLSLEYHDNWQDNEKRTHHGAVMLGAGLTIRPTIKNLDPIQLAEPNSPPLHPELATQLFQEIHMKWSELVKRLTEQLKSFKLGDTIIATLTAAAEKALGPVSDETLAKALVAAFEASGKQMAEAIAAGNKDVTIKLAVPDSFKGGLDEAAVKKLMEDMQKAQADATKKLTEDLAKNQKTLTDAINAAQGLSDVLKKELTESVKDLVTAEMTEEQVKKLANVQIVSGNRIAAASQLSGLGYPSPAGSPVITVEGSNEIKALQEEVDKRLFSGMNKGKRYELSQGVKIEGNNEMVEATLKLYDAQHGRRLHEDYKRWKQLAAGDSLVSDVAIPAIFERTVIRESLFQLVGLGLCDQGTHPFTAVVQLPYSFRDTTAAGMAAARKYEGQAISRAAVKQLIEEARPIPQKLAFEVSDELRYLVGNGQINFDIVAENARNASRIIGEDSEKLIFDEHLNAADQFAITAVSSPEAVATANGTNTIFPLNNFPVLRPKIVRDLQGVQVGSTLYPIVIRTNSVARAEYDGTGTQSAGLYYIMDFNLGEIHFVTELGAPSAPTNTHTVDATYTYTTNVFKWDTDLGSLKVDEKYDDFLYRFGLRKAAIEDRNYMATVALMSGTLRTQIEQARQFGANFKRAGTDLLADGNLGRIKDVPSFRSYAPGLAMGDQRTVIGERGTVRFRMVKPWTLGQLENQKDSNGRFTGKKEAYGDQFIVVHTPTLLKAALTSMVLFSTTARVDRVS